MATVSYDGGAFQVMNLRSQARSLLIQTTGLLFLDSLALRFRRLRANSQALVVAMHETPPSLQTQLHEQLQWASQHFTITNLETFARLWSPHSQLDQDSKPLLLFTFDDGRESNYSVAAPMLESFGGRGVFFIVPAFAEKSAREQALSFYRGRMSPDAHSASLTVQDEDWKPMSPSQIADLASRGHAIGNHTATHARLKKLSSTELECEIGDSARTLSSWTGKPIDAFAWTFGWDAIDKEAWQVIRRYHRFCFSPCAGFIDAKRDHPMLLWRREIEARYSSADYRFCYSGLVDLWWARRRRLLRAMLEV
jgi:peptidoglycan/xylan/chitin deacetylase (PgdA/CDA1 family)